MTTAKDFCRYAPRLQKGPKHTPLPTTARAMELGNKRRKESDDKFAEFNRRQHLAREAFKHNRYIND